MNTENLTPIPTGAFTMEDSVSKSKEVTKKRGALVSEAVEARECPVKTVWVISDESLDGNKEEEYDDRVGNRDDGCRGGGKSGRCRCLGYSRERDIGEC